MAPLSRSSQRSSLRRSGRLDNPARDRPRAPGPVRRRRARRRTGPGARGRSRAGLSRRPLRRKELLWLLRDKGAIVQVILIPLTVAATQAFNFRGLYDLTTGSWNALG